MRPRAAAWLALVALACAAPLSAQGTARPGDARYVASSRGQVYYWVGCDAWRRLSAASLRWFRTAPEAEAAGYRPSEARGCAPQRDTAPIEPAINGTAECTVSRIIDGDTFLCAGGSRIRMLLVDAVEAGQSVWADSALALVRRLMPEGSRVRLDFDVGLRDPYERLLAYVYADNVLVNREIVRRGFGQVVVFPPNVRMVDAMRAAADTARRDKLGLWRVPGIECAPAEFRAGRCRQRTRGHVRPEPASRHIPAVTPAIVQFCICSARLRACAKSHVPRAS